MYSPDHSKFNTFIDSCNFEELWLLKGLCELRLVSYQQGPRTNNFVGDRAEDLAKEVYNTTPGLEKLERPPWVNTKEYDLLSSKASYSVKGVKGKNKVTSAFCGYEGEETPKLFDYVILVRMDELYQLQEILQLDWNTFKLFTKRNSRDKNYKLYLTNKLRESSKKIWTRT